MKSFFIIKRELPRTNNDNFIIQTSDEKSEILNQIKIKGLDISKYTFYDESELSEKNTFIQLYNNSIFEVYFPRTKKADNTYVYYPKPGVVKTPDGTIYVNRWEEVDLNNIDVSSISYICDDSDKEEHQRVLTIFNSKPINQMETSECE